jgi:transcriptional regulator with XRE-family HTH domain
MSDEIAARFLAHLRVLLATSDIPDAELAVRLAVSRPYLSRLRAGERGKPAAVTLAFALRAAAVFPELATFLSPIVPTMTSDVTADKETGSDA